jgi:glyoxylase-like metal-dependent hydrolase (beta-lactamase superfamily II)
MKRFIIILLCCIFSVSLNDLKSQLVYSNGNVQVTKINENLFELKETLYFTANIIAVTGSDSVLLLDTGFKQAASDLSDAVKHLNKGTVKYIINSHGHGDHIGANELLSKDATLIRHKSCEDKSFPKSKLFDNEYHFYFNRTEIICIAFPNGHSPCDIIVYIPSLKFAYLGDIYLSESFPLVDIGSGASAQTVVKNLKKIAEILPKDILIIPGHGRNTTHEDLANYIEMLEKTISKVTGEMRLGKSLEQIQNADVLKEWSEWGKFFSFITKETWIEQIYLSYQDQ